jgi:ABC-type uncharacterized transport system permease subunit
MSNIFFAITAVVLYLWVAFRLARRLVQGTHVVLDKRLPIAVGMGAMTLHGLVLYTTVLTLDGVNLSFFHATSLLTWMVALLVLVTSIYRPVENLAIAVLPLAALSVLLGLLFPGMNTVLDDRDIGLKIHILISVLAFSVLTLAAIQAALLAIQNNHLRTRRPGGFIRMLPPLETMETLLFKMIGLGFALQTLSLISGFAFLEDMFLQHKAHHTLLSFTAWLVFAILLWGRFRFGWRGRTAIRWTGGGFFVLLLAYLGSKLVLELVLRR